MTVSGPPPPYPPTTGNMTLPGAVTYCATLALALAYGTVTIVAWLLGIFCIGQLGLLCC